MDRQIEIERTKERVWREIRGRTSRRESAVYRQGGIEMEIERGK